MNGAIPVATNKENSSWPWNNKPRFVLKITRTSDSGARVLVTGVRESGGGGGGISIGNCSFLQNPIIIEQKLLITLFKLVGWLFIRQG